MMIAIKLNSLFIVYLHLRIAIISLLLINLNVSHADYCEFPKVWTGSWFQKGNTDPIRIIGSNMTEKGICRKVSADKYLLENRQERCFRCLVITEKHQNVLQYKETPSCIPKGRHREPSLNDICLNINGDAPLYSLFRMDVEPVKCPFHGPYKFSYSRGHGECKEPPSSIESCTDDASVLFKFQACTDVQGTESRVEKLECFGEWKDGPVWYLIGKIYHPSAKTDEDRFRCFCFEKKGNTLLLSQSGDATCDGLVSATEGSKTMRAERTIPPEAQCSFPSWLTMNQYWRTLDSTHVYDFSRNQTFHVFNTSDKIYTIAKHIIRVGACIKYENKSNAFNQLVIHSTSGCYKGFVCMRIHKRADNIAELEIGDFLNHPSDACNNMRDNDYITLTTMTSSVKECPIQIGGMFNIKFAESELTLHGPSSRKSLSLCSEQSTFVSRCDQNDHMLFITQCEPFVKKSFKCFGGWNENSSNYLLLSPIDEETYYCLRYNSESDNSDLNVILSNLNCMHLHSSEHNSQKSSRYHLHNRHYSSLSSSSSSLSNDYSSSDIHQKRAIKFQLLNKNMCLTRVGDETNGVNHIRKKHGILLNIFVQSIICWLFIIFKLRL